MRSMAFVIFSVLLSLSVQASETFYCSTTNFVGLEESGLIKYKNHSFRMNVTSGNVTFDTETFFSGEMTIYKNAGLWKAQSAYNLYSFAWPNFYAGGSFGGGANALHAVCEKY